MIVLFLIACLIALGFWLHARLKTTYSFWRNKNVKHLHPTPIVGNYADYILLKKTVGEVTQDICNALPHEPVIGTYFGTNPALILQDPDLIKQVTTKDFYNYNSRENMDYTEKEYIGYMLFFSHGDRWKVLRQNLTPLFSSVKLKQMFYIIKKCAQTLETVLDQETQLRNVIEVKELSKRYTIASIGACVFDIDTDSLKNAKKNPLVKIGDLVFERSVVRALFWAVRCMWPGLFYGIGLKMLPASVRNFFHKLMTAVFEKRNYKPTGKKDFIDLILQLKTEKYLTGDRLNGGKMTLEVNDDFLVSQGLTFFGAGFESSATVLSLALYELAKSQEAQDCAVEEIEKYLTNHGDLDFECISELLYLEACINEVLRLYPVAGIITREVVIDCELAGIQLPRGLRVHIPVYAVHRDARHFPEPTSFKPSRFLPANKQDIQPYTFMPFGEGPRICIGIRFGKMQTMACLVTILKKYRLELAEGTPRNIALEPKSILTQAKGNLNLKFILRK